MRLSICMIVKNEEISLPEALHSVKELADEIILVDTGSTDRTKEIARQFTPLVYDYPWHDDFSAARNFSLSKATHDWILVLDADEAIAKEDHQKIRELLNNTVYVGYSLIQVNYTNDMTLFGYTLVQEQTRYTKNFSGYVTCNILRLFRNHKQIRFKGAVHESIDTSAKEQGTVCRTEIPLHHYQYAKGEEVLRKKQLTYLELYEKNLATYPNQARAYRDLGILSYNFKHDYEKAITFFKKSLQLNSKNVKTYVGLTLCYLKLQQYEHAKNILQQGLLIFPNEKTLQQLFTSLP